MSYSVSTACYVACLVVGILQKKLNDYRFTLNLKSKGKRQAEKEAETTVQPDEPPTSSVILEKSTLMQQKNAMAEAAQRKNEKNKIMRWNFNKWFRA